MIKQLPFQGLKVVDFASFLAGPGASQILAEWGADVVKVEPLSGDAFRYFGAAMNIPMTPDENPSMDLSSSYKRSLAIDLKRPESIEILFKLIEGADVFITNFRSTVLDKYGLLYEQIAERFPRLVYGYLNGYGEVGELADKPGYDYSAYWSRGGILAQLGEPDAPPSTPFGGFGDQPSAIFLACGIIAALYKREKTGCGDKVNVALYHSAIWNMGLMLLAAYYNPGAGRVSRFNPTNPLSNTYKCRDGKWICLIILDARYWPILCQTIGRQDLLTDERFKNLGLMKQNSELLVSILDEEIAKKDRDEWVRIWTEVDMTFEIVQNGHEILVDKQAIENKFLRDVMMPNGKMIKLATMPMKLNNLPERPYQPAPQIGEHSREILLELGYDSEVIEAWVTEGIIGV